MAGLKRKLYCYVDENGQDTNGKLFIVSIVVTESDRDSLLALCEKIEKISLKHKDKWGKAKRSRRLDYINKVLLDKKFKGKLRYSVFENQKNYDLLTIIGIAKAIHFSSLKDYSTSIYVDGLAKSKRQEYGSELRKLGIQTRKVQGVAKDQNNALIRLADSIAGFVRDAVDENDIEENLLKKALKNGEIIKV